MTPTKQSPEFIAKTIPELTEELKSSVNERVVGFLPLTMKNALSVLVLNTHNRKVNWGHTWKLVQAYREGRFVVDASLFNVSRTKYLSDGQHRLIAFILAFGTLNDIWDLLKILVKCGNANFRIKDDHNVTNASSIVPIKGFAAEPKPIPAKLDYIMIAFGTDPEVSVVSGTDQAKRTGADQLGMDIDCANILARFPISEQEAANIIGPMYRRCLPPPPKEAKENAKYGSMKGNGGIHPDRYKVIFQYFAEHMENALSLVHESDEWAYDFFPILHDYLIGGVTLALAGNVSETKIKAFLRSWGACKKITKSDAGTELKEPYFIRVEPPKGTVAWWACEAIRIRKNSNIKRKGDAALITPQILYYAVTRFAQSMNPNPACSSFKQFLDIMGGDTLNAVEQTPENRCLGPDSTTPDELLTDSLRKANKVKANALKKETAAAAKKTA